MTFDDKLDELFIDLPEPSAEIGNTVNFVTSGKLLYVSGVLPYIDGKLQYSGKVGIEVKIDTAKLAAKTAAIAMLGIVNSALGGTINKIKRVVKLEVHIATGVDCLHHEKIADGASELLVQIFGPYGKHVRNAYGVTSLPKNSCVAVSGVFEVK